MRRTYTDAEFRAAVEHAAAEAIALVRDSNRRRIEAAEADARVHGERSVAAEATCALQRERIEQLERALREVARHGHPCCGGYLTALLSRAEGS